MRQKSVPVKAPAAQVVKNIRRGTRRHFSAEDKIRIVFQNLYYRWSKDSRGGEEATCRRYGPGRDIG